ncbi:hypothetical protein FQN57_003523 [Myotisia sp. PD_48]|nr:hypothetical protein FQN57_003523 [Myotisia sp. PD_48]
MSLSDKQNNNSTPAKSFTPPLNSSSAFRPHKAPLTPKLAGYNPPQVHRRLANSDSPSSNAIHHRVAPESYLTHPTTTYSSSSSASWTFNANVTPRSGQRNARREGTASPVATPPSTHVAPRLANVTNVRSGHVENSPCVPESTSSHLKLTRPNRISGESSVSLSNSSRPTSSNGNSLGSHRMFFRADDARSSTSSHDPEQQKLPQPTNVNPTPRSFFYANDSTEGRNRPLEASPKLVVTASRKLAPGPTHIPVRRVEPVISPRLREVYPAISQPKEAANHEPRHHTPSPKITPAPDATLSPIQPLPTNYAHSPLSPDSPRVYIHTKSPSYDSSQISARNAGLLSSPPLHHPVLARDYASLISGEAIDTGSATDNNRLPLSTDSPQQLFPQTAPGPSNEDPLRGNDIQKLNEMATNARRERKVLDLEISNSSLLAINRTLERELRKQNAELRRFRRLSRSGRLSMTPSRRSISGGGLSTLSETDCDDEDGFLKTGHSATQSPDELSELSDEHDVSTSEDESMSSNGVAEHDERHRRRDEKRFLLDLSKHQQLLIDSQKMNQSIKRCVDWTENLILEAKKALEYNVQVSDIEVRGRVLSPDEIDENAFENAHSLLSPTAEFSDSLLPPINLSSEEALI